MIKQYHQQGKSFSLRYTKEINGARPHFVRKMTFSYRKWGQAPFIPRKKSLFLNSDLDG
jgi:hypothetical protein